MKNLFKMMGIIALVAVIGLGFIACDPGDSDPGDGGNSLTPSEPLPFDDITAVQFVAKIKIGWNLGNALDATDFGEGWLSANASVSEMEKAWSNPVTTKAMITAVKDAGFNTIRIPVSWSKAARSNYNIRTDWMTRVTEVVNYAVDNDMYIILNTHHDEDIFYFTEAKKTESLAAYKKIWEQIADNFKNYDEKLIFEGLNEPRVKGSAQEWTGGTDAERAVLNAYYPVFVKAVRESGGNNDKRILMINTYAASANATAVNGLTLPTDTISDKLIVSIHAYAPYTFAYTPAAGSTASWSKSNASDTGAIHDALQPAYDKFVQQGIPVIIGEFGTQHKNNTAARAEWAEYYVSYAKSKGMKCVIWDNGTYNSTEPGAENFGIFNRNNNTFHFPEILAALMKGATE